MKKFTATVLAVILTLPALSGMAREMQGVPHIYDFEDSAGTLYDKLPEDGKTPQWRGYVTGDAKDTVIETENIDPKQGRYLRISPAISGTHLIQHNFRPEWLKENGEAGKVSLSFAVRFQDLKRMRQIYLFDENGKTATQLFEVKNNNGKVALAYVGKWQTGTDENGQPVFETDKEGKVLTQGVRYIEWNGDPSDWYYISFLIDVPERTYQMRIVNAAGNRIGGNINYGEHGCLHGNFTGAPSKLEFKAVSGEADEIWLDDIFVAAGGDQALAIMSENISPESVKAEISVSACFAPGVVPSSDLVHIVKKKFGKTEAVSGYSVKARPNGITLEFPGGLDSMAEYEVTLKEEIRTVYDQTFAPVSFRTGAREGFAAIRGISVLNREGNSCGMLIPSNAGKLAIQFDREMKIESLNNITLENAVYTTEYKPEEQTLYLNFTAPLNPFKIYTLCGGEKVQSAEGEPLEPMEYSFFAGVGQYRTETVLRQNGREESGDIAWKSGDEAVVSAKIHTGVPVTETVLLNVLYYAGGFPVLTKTTAVELKQAAYGEAEVSFTIPENADGGEIRIFFMDTECRPLSAVLR